MGNKLGTDRTTAIVDLGKLARLYEAWNARMPGVRPFYAVKCFPDPRVVRELARLGAGFDCASAAEMRLVRDAAGPSFDPARDVVFAHPCKRPSDLSFAQSCGVRLATFDRVDELHKIKAHHPESELLLRLRVDALAAGHLIPLGLKYGAAVREVPELLSAARDLGLRVSGVSFHAGSGCADDSAYARAIRDAREAFDLAAEEGFDMTTLDLGGGFRHDAAFETISAKISSALEKHFKNRAVHVIAEPGRFFAESIVTLITPVIGVGKRNDKMHYWISDGLYGSFNCIMYENQRPAAVAIRKDMGSESDDAICKPSIVWGPTCDSTDCVAQDLMLPELATGDHLVFFDAGAYTLSGACDFNGIEFTTPVTVYRD